MASCSKNNNEISFDKTKTTTTTTAAAAATTTEIEIETKTTTTTGTGTAGRKDKTNTKRVRAYKAAIMTANKPGDPIAITFEAITLRISDVQLLQGPRYINEAIVSFYYSYLETERYKSNNDIVFVPPETAQCMSLMESDEMEPLVKVFELSAKPFVFFVFNDEHDDGKNSRTVNHFSLVVFSRPEKTYFYYDSCSTTSKTVPKVTQHFIHELSILMNCNQWQLKPIRNHSLMNTAYDCGIRVLCMTDHIANYVNRFECIAGIAQLPQDIVSAKRTEMLKLIYTLGGNISL